MAKIITIEDAYGIADQILNADDGKFDPEILERARQLMDRHDLLLSEFGTLISDALKVDVSEPDLSVSLNSSDTGYMAGTFGVTPRSPSAAIPDELKIVDPEGDWEPSRRRMTALENDGSDTSKPDAVPVVKPVRGRMAP